MGVFAMLVAGCGGEDPSLYEAGDAQSDAPRSDAPRADAPVIARPDVAIADVPAVPMDAEDLTPDMQPDGGAPAVDVEAPPVTAGATMRVTATSLNLRSGAGTTNAILTSMMCGAQVLVVGGPASGWWNVRFGTTTGWASGTYLVAESAFNPAVCTSAPPPTMPAPPTGAAPEVARFFELARYAVGYSYWWGHGAWRSDGAQHGSCAGSCPSCTHAGSYGADCSGFVAKVWQVPGASPITTDAHPYSTWNFFNTTAHWSQVSRSAVRAGDALTYNTSGHGHIALFESGTDPWGDLWVFEARGCSYGIVHNSRPFGSAYVGIRREGL